MKPVGLNPKVRIIETGADRSPEFLHLNAGTADRLAKQLPQVEFFAFQLEGSPLHACQLQDLFYLPVEALVLLWGALSRLAFPVQIRPTLVARVDPVTTVPDPIRSRNWST